MGILEDSKRRFEEGRRKYIPDKEFEKNYQEIYRELCHQTRISQEKLDRRLTI